MPLFRVVATNLVGTPVGELTNVADLRVRHAFNGRLKTTAFKVRLVDPLADFLLSGQALAKVYDGTTLRNLGELQTFEETSDSTGGAVALTFADGWNRLGDPGRLLGKSPVGYADGTALAPKDKTLLVANMLAAANANASGVVTTGTYTGIEVSTQTNTGATGFVAFSPYTPAAEGITGVVNNIDGPDVELVPVEPVAVSMTGGTGTRLWVMNIVPALGQARPAAVFEYGTGKKNVAEYRRAGDLTSLLNSAYGLSPSSDPAAAVLTKTDATSQATFGLREGRVTSDLAVAALRQSLVDEHVRVRKAPRILVTFTPTREDKAAPGRVPVYGTDFGLGDTITFRAVNPLTGAVRVNAALRVYAVDWTRDAEGASVPSFSLTAD